MSGGIHVSGTASVTLLPGVYYLQGGGLWVLGRAKLSGTGVTIYNAPKTAADQVLIATTDSVIRALRDLEPTKALDLSESRLQGAGS